MQDNHSFFSGVATIQCNYSLFSLLPGNVIPHCWYKSFTIKGCPDFSAIIILADIVAWWRNLDKIISSKDSRSPEFNGKSLSMSYEYLHEKFGFNKETARRAFVRLEEYKTLTRHVKNIKLEDGSNVNRLHIVLDQKFYHSCFRSSEYDIRTIPSRYTNTKVDSQANDKPNTNKILPSPMKCGDLISNNTKGIEDRSNESNSVENKLEEKGKAIVEPQGLKAIEAEQFPQTLASQSLVPSMIDKIKAKLTRMKRLPIGELAPITESEAYNLRLTSNREFSLNYMNKLKERLGKKYPEHGFHTRTKFLEYMSKTLANELREATLVNNEAFNFKQDADRAKIENYLKTIEDCRATDQLTQLRKKIAARFEGSKSYKILTSCRFKEKVIDKKIFEISLLNNLTLNESESNSLLEEVRAVFGDQIIKLHFYNNQVQDKASDSNNDRLELNLGKEGTIWHKVSKKLLELYGENIHKAWFSKLEAIEEKDSERFTLSAPTNFIKYYVDLNYLSRIEDFLRLFRPTFKFIAVEVK